MKRPKIRPLTLETFREWAWEQNEDYEWPDTHRVPVDNPRLSVADRPVTKMGEAFRPFD